MRVVPMPRRECGAKAAEIAAPANDFAAGLKMATVQ